MMGHFEKSGGFLTVRDAGGRVNTMTISWGFAGVIWSKPHFVTVVRPSRYTYELLKTADSFTVSVPFGGLKDELRVCGAESGRDVDKSKIVEFAPSKSVDSPIVAGCDFYYECIINYRDGLHGGKMPPAIDKAHYNGDWHDFFIGEIVEVY
jgi:flavin reductase (DIM6/NTAB) family NADH-FMN oxidoreductase RutF